MVRINFVRTVIWRLDKVLCDFIVKIHKKLNFSKTELKNFELHKNVCLNPITLQLSISISKTVICDFITSKQKHGIKFKQTIEKEKREKNSTIPIKSSNSHFNV